MASSWYIKPSVTRLSIIGSVIFLAGCGSVSVNSVTVQDLSFNIPTSYQTISSQSLDNAQIAHTILAARKDTNSSIVISESSLPSSLSIKDFSEQSANRLGQQMMWYTKVWLTTKSFTCNGQDIEGYKHTFTENDIKDTTKVLTYYEQFAFARNGSVYIISLAQKEEKSIFDDIITSLTCKAQ